MVNNSLNVIVKICKKTAYHNRSDEQIININSPTMKIYKWKPFEKKGNLKTMFCQVVHIYANMCIPSSQTLIE